MSWLKDAESRGRDIIRSNEQRQRDIQRAREEEQAKREHDLVVARAIAESHLEKIKPLLRDLYARGFTFDLDMTGNGSEILSDEKTGSGMTYFLEHSHYYDGDEMSSPSTAYYYRSFGIIFHELKTEIIIIPRRDGSVDAYSRWDGHFTNLVRRQVSDLYPVITDYIGEKVSQFFAAGQELPKLRTLIRRLRG